MPFEGLPSAPLGLALPCLAAEPPAGIGWIAERKNDGYRLAIEIAGDHARCLSRSGRDVTARYGWIAELAAGFPTNDMLVDGEVVVQDETGKSDFGWLQKALAGDKSSISYIAFDVMRLNGYDLTGMPTSSRKELLAILVGSLPQDGEAIISCAEYSTHSPTFLADAADRGFETVIFKRANAPYRPGRTLDWLEVDCRAR